MSQKGHITGMAGEFYVMEKLFRLGHEAALTLGNAKSIDIFTKSPKNNLYEVSVKAIRGGGKWGIGKENYSNSGKLVFVLLHYKDFEDVNKIPDAWVLPAKQAEKIKRKWHEPQFAIYCYKEDFPKLEKYKNAWHFLD